MLECRDVSTCPILMTVHPPALCTRTTSTDNIRNGAGKEGMLKVVSVIHGCMGGEGVWVCGGSPEAGPAAG